MRAETEIRDDLSVRPATIMEAATHQAEHGHIHCQCPARLWVEARDRLARDTGQLLDLHDQDMARVSEALNRAITERDHAREEWHRQNERADDYRRQLLDETYRPEGGEIVLRELRKAQREREEALARIGDLEEDLERAIGDIEEWAAYADTYIREKWDLDGCLAWHREVLAGSAAAPEATEGQP